jgi:error-prone DNA polymerase
LQVASGQTVAVAGVVIVRQRPETAKGFVFLTLEDESGLSNILVAPDVFAKNRTVLLTAPVLVIQGPLQSEQGTLLVKVNRALPLEDAICTVPSRDFH